MEKPTIKISKVAREFNVGHNTIIEFLQKKGFNVDLDPNAKLSDEMYKLLKKEFSEPIQKKESRVNANQSEVRFEPELTGTYEIEFNNVQEKTAKSKNAKQTPSKQEKFHADKPTREVQVLQNALKEIGFFNSVSDGIYGPLTRKAVMIFQESAGLPQDADLDDEAYQTLLEKINAYTKANQAKPGKEQTTRSEQTTILENENPINENKPGLSEYEFVINEDLNNRNFSSNFLIVRIGWERIREFVVDGDHFDFDRANWGSILAAFILPSDLTDEIRILPFITLPVDNLPLILKSANVDFEGENFKVETDLYIIETSFKYQITSERLLKELPTLSSNRILGNDKIYEGAVFISKEEFDKIRELGIKGFIGERFNKAAISKLDTDSPYLDIEDELGFEGDYKALASVMAYKKLEPPLAIGLFGNWGSGKSFFMNKLEKEINILANDKNLQDVYCQEVVQVKFNSWHYSDSNLWASLITKIFEDLQKHKNDDSEAVKNLFKNLNSTKGLVAAAQQKIDSIKVEVQLLENEKAKAEGEIEKKAGELNTLRYRDIAVAIWNNPVIKENREKIDQIFPDKLSENIQSIKTRVNELSSFTNQVIESAKIIYKFRKGKKPIALLVGFAVFVLSCFLILQYQGKSLDFLNWVTVKSSLIVTALTQLVGFLMPVMGKVNTAYKNLKDLEQTYVELVEKEKSANYLAINDLERLIEMKQVELRKYEEEIAQLKQEKKEKEQEIDDITSGRKLSQFIQRIVSDSKYKESLGIISWIRKDFEELNFLLKIQNEITEKQLKELKRSKVDNIFKIDRIILYIDDLDRCHEDIVVRVLEAIHLLLAFPLFVVVVGVDPRWMHNALSLKYKDLLNVESSGITVKNPLFKYRIDEAHRIRLRNQKFIGTVATSYDYIEKIFQIPFLLKPIDDKGKDQLIESQLNITTGKHDSKIEDTITIEQPKNIEVEESSSQSKNQVNKVSPVQTSLRQTVITNAQPKVKPVPGKSQKNKEATKLRSALLEISIDEVRFMQGISFLIGDTPRTIKRYVNIYRVIRIHPRFAFADSNELEHYAAAMVLLAMVTGMTDQSKDFFDKLRNDTVSETFGQFLQTWLDAPGNSAPLLVTLVESLDKEEALKDLSNIHIDKFKINLDLVSRFTFRN